MTASFATKRLSKPETIARQIESLDCGWEVTRHKEGSHRMVIAVRGDQRFQFLWRRTEAERDVYVEGDYTVGEVTEPWFNVAAALRIMARPTASYLALLPDVDVLKAVAGRTLVWRNSVSDRLESATPPSGGLHLKITNVNKYRMLTFADAGGHGFRSVRLGQIEEIK